MSNTTDRITAVCKAHRDAKNHLDMLMSLNSSGRSPEQQFEADVAIVKAQAQLTRTEADRRELLKELSA